MRKVVNNNNQLVLNTSAQEKKPLSQTKVHGIPLKGNIPDEIGHFKQAHDQQRDKNGSFDNDRQNVGTQHKGIADQSKVFQF